jgi:hypothetical protein
MHFSDFINSLEQNEPPAGLGPHLRALWYDAGGDWNTAHEIVQQMHDATAARIHAYLHREEGDDWNARYWHGRAGSVFPQAMSLEQEWEMLVRQVLDSNGP